MALRLGPLIEEAVRATSRVPDLLLLDATAHDHPRRAGLALHLGAELDIPTIGVTHRPLVASGEWPSDHRGATSPLRIGDSVVGCWLRTQRGVRPLAVHPGWRIDVATAVEVVTMLTRGVVHPSRCVERASWPAAPVPSRATNSAMRNEVGLAPATRAHGAAAAAAAYSEVGSEICDQSYDR